MPRLLSAFRPPICVVAWGTVSIEAAFPGHKRKGAGPEAGVIYTRAPLCVRRLRLRSLSVLEIGLALLQKRPDRFYVVRRL
jgi:hypothetical protein